ncbi:hypothetical protein SDC9_164643 [bioreactor metagenome]|uniref:Uncharacterized protein n=1 Tax=bioreactor metagenome TaxID=1076179 RepID=A0A645FTP6_9ZZZZ
MVPFSFSLTMVKEVSITVMFCRINPITPGILKLLLSIVGLYKVKGFTLTLLPEFTFFNLRE